MVEFSASSSGLVVSRTFMCLFAGTLNVFKRVSNLLLKWSVLSRVLTGSAKQCSTFTNQFSSLRGRHSV